MIKSLIKATVISGFTWPIVYLSTKFIADVSPISNDKNYKKITLLAINPVRFRGDLEILANSNNFRVLKVPLDWQCKILNLYWPKKIDFQKYYKPDPIKDQSIIRLQSKLRTFLKIYLTALYKKLGVDGVIGAGLNYKQDYDWGFVSEEIGVPYIVLVRENIANSAEWRNDKLMQYERMKEFKGSYIIVHNRSMMDLVIQSGHITPDKISSLGCLRMDKYVKKVKVHNDDSNNKPFTGRKKTTLFSFAHGTGLGGLGVIKHYWSEKHGFVKLFEHVHVSFAKLAMENKEVDFIIKPKWGGRWVTMIDNVLRDNHIKVNNIDNLCIIPDANVHDLIFESDVICAFQSTTMLEAAIHADKKVIIPFFDEAKYIEYEGYIQSKDDYYLFDLANSVREFEEHIIEGLRMPKRLDDYLLQKRYRLFEKYVSSMEGNSLDKYTKVIKKVIKERQCA